MKILLPILIILSGSLAGCVTKSQADARARIAFLEGQNQALMRSQASLPVTQASSPGVTFIGPVQNLEVPWHTGLTLTQGIIGAQYTGNTDPSAIVIHRNGQEISVNPKDLLNGQDFVLQIGDVIEIQP